MKNKPKSKNLIHSEKGYLLSDLRNSVQYSISILNFHKTNITFCQHYFGDKNIIVFFAREKF